MLIEITGLSKSYQGSRALDGVTLEVRENEIVGVVGENGAGKSTLLNILSGITRPDAGEIVLKGRRVEPRNYHEANLLGIFRVFQEQALIPNIPVYENLLLSHERRFSRFGQLLDRRRMIETATRIVEEIGLDIDVTRQTSDYDFSRRQAVEIARACLVPEVLGIAMPLILLDEPTSALNQTEVTAFLSMIERLRQRASFLFVSHRLSEILAVCDRIYVLKDGRLVGQLEAGEANENLLHGMMVGRERDSDYYHEEAQRAEGLSRVAFGVRGLTSGDAFSSITFDVHEGEVLGIGGLLDSGKSGLGRAMVGIDRVDAGVVRVGEHPPMTPELRRLMRLGVGYIPAERHAEGMIVPFSITWNMSMASGQDIFSNAAGVWRPGLEHAVASDYVRRLAVKASSPDVVCTWLSGGNQQKVVLAKWLCRNPKVLVLDNPTRGVDAGAKEEIYRLLRQLTAHGVAVVLITDELLELIGMSNRIAIMRGGQITHVVEAPVGGKPSERELISRMLGSER